MSFAFVHSTGVRLNAFVIRDDVADAVTVAAAASQSPHITRYGFAVF